MEEVSETEAREEDWQKDVVEESKVDSTTFRPVHGLLKLMAKNPLLAKAATYPEGLIHSSGTPFLCLRFSLT